MRATICPNKRFVKGGLKIHFSDLYKGFGCANFCCYGHSENQFLEAVMVKKRSGIIPALILLAAMLAVMAEPAPAATLLLF
jgi:hypothetical protein